MNLLIGCGRTRDKRLMRQSQPEWDNLVTLDIEACHKPDILWDLESPEPIPLPDCHFDEIHAYHVLEHTGRQGDWRFFFRQWADFYRLLKPASVFFGICPDIKSPWAWGDPGHTRIIGPECLTFLDQSQYEKQVGKSSMTDYRSVFQGDFDVLLSESDGSEFRFAIQAIKPSRVHV